MIWFTSDEHYGHTKVLLYNKRPYEFVEEMDKDLIKRFNEVVMPDDITIHAGDFCWCNNKKDAYEKYANKLNGNHTFLIGSHDHWLPKSAKYIWRKRIEDKLIMVCHYAMLTWECSHYNSWQLYGHSHGHFPLKGKQHDVGVDNNNYYPVSFDQIKDIMATKKDNWNCLEHLKEGKRKKE